MRVIKSVFQSVIAVGFAVYLSQTSATANQLQPNFGNFFGAFINQALTSELMQQWDSQGQFEHDCVAGAGLSPDQLASRGIGPRDIRIKALFDHCRAQERDAKQSPPSIAAKTSDFTVGGLAAGGNVIPDGKVYQSYKCRDSQEFPRFKWCARKRSFSGKFGPYDSWTTILHSDQNVAAFVEEEIVPAYFSVGDADAEIQRLSQRFGQSAQILKYGPGLGLQQSVIATWGALTLSPLDAETMKSLAQGKEVKAGLLVDFLGDSRKSARSGLPVYHMGGGAGYIWAAFYDERGQGRLRLVSDDPSLLPNEENAEGSPQTESSNVSSYAPNSPTPGPSGGATAPQVTAPIQTPDPAVLEKRQQERTDRAIAAAKVQLDDVGAFLKENPHNPKLLDYVERAGALSSAIKSNDPTAIERKMTDLSDALSHDKDYQTHLASVAEGRKREEAKFLGDAIHRGQQQRDFLLSYIAKNPIADGTVSFVEDVKELNSVLQRVSLDQLQPVIDKIDLAIREANLESEFMAAEKLAQERQIAKASNSAVASSSDKVNAVLSTGEALPVTNMNRFLMEGDLSDVELLYNAAPSAPHVAQNLRGDFVFSQGVAEVCLFGEDTEDFRYVVNQEIVKKAGSRGVETHFQACDPSNLTDYDLVATIRGSYLKSAREDALSLLKQVETGAMRPFAEINAPELAKSAKIEQAAIDKITKNVSDGNPPGFGIVLLKDHSSALCTVVTSKSGAHYQLLLHSEVQLKFEMQTQPVFKNTGIEDAFIDSQKSFCGAIYASTSDLKTLTGALSKANIPFTFSSVWFLPTDVDHEEADLAERAKAAAQEETERAQRNADSARLAAQREKDEDAQDAAKQAQLREKFGATAKAAADALAAGVISLSKGQSSDVAGMFPDFASWLSDKIADHWDIIGIDNLLEDYGTSSFKGRAIETVFTRVTLHLRNRMLGEYKDGCFIFGRMNDTEFSMFREPIISHCNDAASVISWQAGHEFKSEWTVSGTN